MSSPTPSSSSSVSTLSSAPASPMPLHETLTPAQQQDLATLAAITETRRRLRVRARPPRPAQKKKDTGRIPRPVNCFMAYRLEKQKTIADLLPGANHRDISKLVANWWRDEPEYIKEKYRAQAEKTKEEHSQKYPDYKYAPIRKRAYNIKRRVAVPDSSEDEQSSDTSSPASLSYPSCQLHLSHSPLLQSQEYHHHQQQQHQYHHRQQPVEPSYQWTIPPLPALYPNAWLWNPSNNSSDPMLGGDDGSMSTYCTPSYGPARASVLSHDTLPPAGEGPIGSNYTYYSDFMLMDGSGSSVGQEASGFF
ncbi:hypothetical protein BDB00DRAFT_797589 [Zychaea mexicana]|uniref:uncharacterized protein n=1 Tax=Zychaea mexicana TaxID=64656 RepID=UPI0022FE35FA|nr:uncharacterized protein BDB00DRAFT_797589 [Zychaea mexicana]KAI9498967.1 hypothetical protein BDB00DRAFT_797589 [Zychaea mexicana]